MRCASTGNCARRLLPRQIVACMSPMGALLGGCELACDGLRQPAAVLPGHEQLGVVDAALQQRMGHALDDQRACAGVVQPALAGIEQGFFGQGAPGGAVRGLHLVVQDFEVRAQHQPGLARERNAGEALAHGGLVGAGGDARVGGGGGGGGGGRGRAGASRARGGRRVGALPPPRAPPLASARDSTWLVVWATWCTVCTCCSSAWLDASSRPAERAVAWWPCRSSVVSCRW